MASASIPATPQPSGSGTNASFKRPRRDSECSTTSSFIERQDEGDEPNAKIARVLECPVCLVVPRGHIYYCKSNHHICSKCYNLENVRATAAGGKMVCPTGRCAYPKSKHRSLLGEKMVEASGYKFRCDFSNEGCAFKGEKTPLVQHLKHKCLYKPLLCPLGKEACKVNRINFLAHCRQDHAASHLPASLTTSQISFSLRKDHLEAKAPDGNDPTQAWVSRVFFPKDAELALLSGMVKGRNRAVVSFRADLKQEEVKNMRYELEINSPDGEHWMYRGPFVDLEEDNNVILNEEKGLVLTLPTLKRLVVDNKANQANPLKFVINYKFITAQGD